MFINIYFYSKNYKSLKKIFFLFYKLCQNNSLKIKKFSVQYQKKKKKKFFTVLKSPHVNKRAQDHFEYCLYKKQISVCSLNIFKILIILKRIQLKLFSDVKIKIKFLLSAEKLKKNLKFQYKSNKNFFKSNLDNTLKTFDLKFFDIYGEIKFKNVVIKYNTLKV